MKTTDIRQAADVWIDIYVESFDVIYATLEHEHSVEYLEENIDWVRTLAIKATQSIFKLAKDPCDGV